MKLETFIRLMEKTALAQPAVRSVVENDVFRINSLPDVEYGVFAFVQKRHSEDIEDGWRNLSFSLIYADRLTVDGKNEISVQSTALETLGAIVKALAEEGLYISGNLTVQPFTERFKDLCAGGFADVTFRVPADSTCAEDLGIEIDETRIY